MDVDAILGILRESLFMIAVFGGFLIFGMLRGMQAIINVILALYLALLVSLKFPYFDAILTGSDDQTNAIIMIVIFLAFTIFGYFLFCRLMSTEYREPPFRRIGKKIIFAIAATVLVMAYSYHALPVTDIITPGSPIQALFAPEQNFFWWLVAPLVALLFV